MNTQCFFENCATLDDLQREYHKLAKQYHPDCGGDTVTMQAINEAYAAARKGFSGQDMWEEARINWEEVQRQQEEEHKRYNRARRQAAMRILATMPGIFIQVEETIIWVSGHTYEYKEELKVAGFSWDPDRRKWLFR